jgi:hypothetical protein
VMKRCEKRDSDLRGDPRGRPMPSSKLCVADDDDEDIYFDILMRSRHCLFVCTLLDEILPHYTLL